MSKENKELSLRVLLGTLKTILLAVVIYAASSPLLVLIFYQDSPAGTRDFTPIHLIMPVIFALAYYLTYLGKYSEDLFVGKDGEFSPKSALVDFFKADGKYLLILYGILGILCEIALWFHIVPISTSLYPCFSVASAVKIPILRIVAAYVVIMAMIFVTTVIKHYRQHRYWAKKK